MEEKRRRRAAPRAEKPRAASPDAPEADASPLEPAVREPFELSAAAKVEVPAGPEAPVQEGEVQDRTGHPTSAHEPPQRAPTATSTPAEVPSAATPRLEGAPATSTATVALEEPSFLEVERLVKIYGGRTVVDNVSFTVRRGEIIGILGKNGAGKTTTFRMTIGMIPADDGVIRFLGRDVTRLPMYRRARLGMGYLSQESSVFRGLTVEQNLNAILETTELRASERVRRRDELVEEFGLGRLLHSKAAVLSGGEKRRLEIARALITDPSLILLDEPFSGVDPIAVSDIQQIIFRLKERGIGILLTDHNVRETLNTTDRSFIILDGRIIAQGNRDEILGNPHARRYYLGESFTM